MLASPSKQIRTGGRSSQALNVRKRKCEMTSFRSFLACLVIGFKTFRHPRELLVIAVALTLGIGVTAAAYCLIYAAVIRPLPYRDSGTLVQVWEGDASGSDRWVSDRYVAALREAPSAFSSIATFRSEREEWAPAPGAPSVPLVGASVSHDMFEMLGAHAQAGRTFGPADAQLGQNALIVSERLARLSPLPSKVGDQLNFGGTTYRIVGVMPASFWFPDRATTYWKPLAILPPQLIGNGMTTALRSALGRLKPGFTPSTAEAWATTRVQAADGQYGRSRMHAEFYEEIATRSLRPSLLVLQVTSAAVFGLICVNVSWLFMARARRLESGTATMRALGASPFQILTAGAVGPFVVAAITGPCAVLLAWAILRIVVADLDNLFARTSQPAISAGLALVAVGAAFFTALLAWTPSAVVSLRSAGTAFLASRTVTRRRAFDRIAIVAQLSLVVALGAQSVLLATVLRDLVTKNVGLRRTSADVIELRERSSGTQDAQLRLAQYKQLLEGLNQRQLTAALIVSFPLAGGTYSSVFEPRRGRDHQQAMVYVRVVTPSYFQITGMTPVSGRLLNSDDVGAHRVVVTPPFLASLFPGGDALGKRTGFQNEWTIVGVTESVRQFSVYDQPDPEAYVLYDDYIATRPDMAEIYLRNPYLLVDGGRNSGDVLNVVRQMLQATAADVTAVSATSVSALIRNNLAANHLVAAGSVILAAVALALTLLGIYGIVSYTVTARFRELCVRIALGATPQRVCYEVATPFLKDYALAVCLGSALFLLLRSAMSAVMVPPPGSTSASSDFVLTMSSAALFLAMAAACYRPLSQIRRINPSAALGTE